MIVLVLKNGHRITRIQSKTVILTESHLKDIVSQNMGSTTNLSEVDVAVRWQKLINTLESEGLWDYSLQKWNPEFNVGWSATSSSEYNGSIGSTFEQSDQFKAWIHLIKVYKTPTCPL